MQLNVERGPMATGKTTRLRQVAREAGQDEHQIIDGCAYTAADLELLVRCRVGRGAKVICIDDCPEHKVERLEGLKGDLPSDLTIHVVVAA